MAGTIGFKRALFESFAGIGKALASGARIELIELLGQAERTVEQLVEESGLSFANVSQHLQVLRRARFVEVRREGLHAFYRLANDQVFGVWQAVRTLGETSSLEVQEVVRVYLHDREHLEAVTATELARRLEEGSVVVLDVRPPEEYAAGHIPGAVSIPVASLSQRLKELSRSTEIIAYCRGPYCIQSDKAVALLSRNGFKAKRLEIGLPDWRTSGRPVETAAAGSQVRGLSGKTRKPR